MDPQAVHEATDPEHEARQVRVSDLKRQVAMEFWKPLALCMVTAILTGTGFWITVGRTMVTRPEVMELIQTQSPYVRDRTVLLDQVQHVSNLTAKVDQMRTTQVEMKIILGMMAQKAGVPIPRNWVEQGRETN